MTYKGWYVIKPNQTNWFADFNLCTAVKVTKFLPINSISGKIYS